MIDSTFLLVLKTLLVCVIRLHALFKPKSDGHKNK